MNIAFLTTERPQWHMVTVAVSKLGVNRQPREGVMTVQQRFPFYDEAPPGYKWVFRPWITHPKTGKRIYPKRARVFKLLVPI